MLEISTNLGPANAPPAPTTLWDANFRALHARFPKSNASILFCLHELQQSDTMSMSNLKALAAMHGIRITGASLTAARRLMVPRVARPRRAAVAAEGGSEAPPAGDDAAQRDGRPELAVRADDSVPEQGGPGQQAELAASAEATASAARRLRVKQAQPDHDLGEMVLQAVQQAAGDAEAKAERLRAAVRSAIEVLREAVD